MNQVAFNQIHRECEWPDLTGVPPWDYTLGGGGRDLIDRVITESSATTMLEIGCFLCSSARRWLSNHTNLKLVGIDPWDDSLIDQVARYIGRPNLTRKYPDAETQHQMLADITKNGPYATALANVVEFKDRFAPVRGLSPEKLYDLKNKGYEPDIVYIDCNKKPDELEVSHKLWPNAHITGDDWHWNRAHGYPMRTVVNTFAEKHGFTVEADWATWILKR